MTKTKTAALPDPGTGELHDDDKLVIARFIAGNTDHSPSRLFDDLVGKIDGLAEFRNTVAPDLIDQRNYFRKLLSYAIEIDEPHDDARKAREAERRELKAAAAHYTLDSDIPF
ncbi:hypothetical protein QO001_005037 [Methylobacterium brachiatum]|uniref:Terminase small subunit n=1 Tax=Methylobacterium brachiatum TaxID=269660 RepID=A0AAJ1X061_9HYPH|nr:hypothetical protein [Methylobacterium brachiatum]MCB4805166.1 hypothetical protein [Methylobacterium brachiatum]MDQ0546088.1 hypothetical protein [Methylobacterium brachiatum]